MDRGPGVVEGPLKDGNRSPIGRRQRLPGYPAWLGRADDTQDPSRRSCAVFHDRRLRLGSPPGRPEPRGHQRPDVGQQTRRPEWTGGSQRLFQRALQHCPTRGRPHALTWARVCGADLKRLGFSDAIADAGANALKIPLQGGVTSIFAGFDTLDILSMILCAFFN